MKKTLFVLLAVTVFACGSPKQKKTESTSDKNNVEKIKPETINKEVPDEENGGTMLLGKINKQGLTKEPYADWFQANQDFHKLDTATVEKIKPLLNDVKITAFMGTWCSDSQREIPAFYKILDQANYDYSKLKLYAMNTQKLTDEGYENSLDINYVPTLIFYKNGKEIGRFVEHAQETLEKDIYAILSGADYKHSYQE